MRLKPYGCIGAIRTKSGNSGKTEEPGDWQVDNLTLSGC